jgi:threonylcarbamoyladenosine tRNA methylthiotransferase MtaB
MPTAAIGADVMVGFPGETDAEFESTRRLIEDLPLTYLHVFTYSARPGTPAAKMPNQVPVHAARERNRILRELAAEKKLAFLRGFIGQAVDAITLNVVGNDDAGEFTEALTDNYLKLRLRGRHEPNRWLSAQIEDVVDEALAGSLDPGQATRSNGSQVVILESPGHSFAAASRSSGFAGEPGPKPTSAPY